MSKVLGKTHTREYYLYRMEKIIKLKYQHFSSILT